MMMGASYVKDALHEAARNDDTHDGLRYPHEPALQDRNDRRGRHPAGRHLRRASRAPEARHRHVHDRPAAAGSCRMAAAIRYVAPLLASRRTATAESLAIHLAHRRYSGRCRVVAAGLAQCLRLDRVERWQLGGLVFGGLCRRDGARAAASCAMNNMLKELRAQNGMTQADLAERLGVSRQTIIAIESSRYDPSLPQAFAIARVLGRKIEEIFTDNA